MAVKVEVMRGTLCKSRQGSLGTPITFCLMGAKRSQSRAGGSAGLKQLSWKSRQAGVEVPGVS